jgi:hypothetical protein
LLSPVVEAKSSAEVSNPDYDSEENDLEDSEYYSEISESSLDDKDG